MQKTSGKNGHYAKLICPIHHSVYLTQAEYDRQLNKANNFWRCPKCNSKSEFDGTYFKEEHVSFFTIKN